MQLKWIGTICAAVIALVLTGQNPAFAEFVARHGLNSAQYQAAFDQYVSKGYRLSGVDAYSTPAGVRYAAIWERRGGSAWVARHGMNAGAYQAAFNKYTGQSFRPLDISASAIGLGNGTFTALWGKGGGPWVARHGLTSGQYQAAFDQFVGQGYRLIDVEGYATQGGVVRYAAVWEKKGGPAWLARHGLTSGGYQAAFDKAVGQGYRLMHVDGYLTTAGVRYAAIWERRKGPPWVARHGLTSGQYQAAFNKNVGKGYKLVHVSGYWDGKRERYAAIWSR